MLKKYHWLKNLVFVGLFSFLAAQIANRVVIGQIHSPRIPDASNIPQAGSARKPTARKTLAYYKPISERNIFNSDDTGDQPQSAQRRETVEAPLQQTNLDVELIGTVVGAPALSFAVVLDNKTRKQELFRIDDMIQDTARVLAIDRCKVVVLRNGTEEILECPEDDEKNRSTSKRASYKPSSPTDDHEIKKVSDDEYLIAEEEVEEALDNMNVLMTQIRVVPNFKDGQANGFKVFAIKPNSIFAKIGLKNGDVLQSVNDRDMTTPDKAFQVFNDLRSEKSLSVDILRRGQKKRLSYEIR